MLPESEDTIASGPAPPGKSRWGGGGDPHPPLPSFFQGGGHPPTLVPEQGGVPPPPLRPDPTHTQIPKTGATGNPPSETPHEPQDPAMQKRCRMRTRGGPAYPPPFFFSSGGTLPPHAAERVGGRAPCVIQNNISLKQKMFAKV